jgi:glycosyltransferase involved in cell wall biosynthesis
LDFMSRPLLVISGRMYGGGQRVVLDLLQESRKSRNLLVDVCLLGTPVTTMPAIPAEVVEYDGRYNRPLTLWKTAGRLRKTIKRLQPALVHSHGWDAAIIGALALFSLRIPHLIHVHTTDAWLGSRQLKHRVRRALTRWMFNRPRTTVVGVSDAVQQHWCAALNSPPDSFRVIRNGVDIDRFRPAQSHRQLNGPLMIGVASRLQPSKGFEDLFRALAILAEDDLHPVLQIAGDGGFRETLESQIGKLGLGQQVKFLGFVRDMEKFYRSIDLAVLPSLSEGLPIFVLEAMACGIPIVATDVGGTREVLRDGIDGFIVAAREPAILADALRKLLQNPEDRRRMGVNARCRIEAGFSSTIFFERVSELYQEMLAPRMSVHAGESHENVCQCNISKT